MRAIGAGAIVNISSSNALVALPMRLAYSAATSVVISMTKILAVEWAPYGIHVNATGQVMAPDGGRISFGWIPWTGDLGFPGVPA
jgi:NAD(P)-dependent dehydrogenase (short-subunit alcohol dehydrogenase family)